MPCTWHGYLDLTLLLEVLLPEFTQPCNHPRRAAYWCLRQQRPAMCRGLVLLESLHRKLGLAGTPMAPCTAASWTQGRPVKQAPVSQARRLGDVTTSDHSTPARSMNSSVDHLDSEFRCMTKHICVCWYVCTLVCIYAFLHNRGSAYRYEAPPGDQTPKHVLRVIKHVDLCCCRAPAL